MSFFTDNSSVISYVRFCFIKMHVFQSWRNQGLGWVTRPVSAYFYIIYFTSHIFFRLGIYIPS